MNTFPLLPAVLAALLAAPASAQLTLEQVREEVRKELSEQRKANPAAAFNPAMGVVLDAVGKHTRTGQGQFDFRGAELNFSADVDPYSRLYAVINGRADEVEVEEAAFQTKRLPGSLALRGGRYFANFGRLPKFHDHELPFVERTESLDRFLSGEARTEGVELTHLFRTPFFLQGTLGLGNKLGAENDRLDETTPATQDGHANGRPLQAFTYNGRLFTYAPLGEDWGLDLGASAAYTPRQYYVGGARADLPNTQRLLNAADLTVRWEPLGDNVRKALWSTEVFRNNERRRTGIVDEFGNAIQDANGNDIFDNIPRTAWGGFTVVDVRVSPRLGVGAYGDFAEDLDDRKKVSTNIGAFLNVHVSEFQRIRFQVSRLRDNFGGKADVRGFVQYTAIIGKHAHTFKDR
jgi:hypothetical protein